MQVADTPLEVGIVADAARIYKQISDWCLHSDKEWSDSLKRLACGILGCYKMRLVDMSMREHTHLLYIILGDRALRSRAGKCYTYQEAIGLLAIN